MATRRRKNVATNTDAVRMLEVWTRDDGPMRALLAEERSKAAVARQVYELRTARGLTQKQLAGLIGTKQPVIARSEDADYQGHSLAMLYRIAAALDCRVSVGFVSRSRSGRRNAQRVRPQSRARRTQAEAR
jgi:ribosome-binding protein aMBF1 (putative translation factor)